MALYQCLLLGSPTGAQVSAFTVTFDGCLGLFGMQGGRDYTIERGITAGFSDTTATVAVFFGTDGARYTEAARRKRLGVPVVPVVSSVARVSAELPIGLRSINAIFHDAADIGLRRVVTAALQCRGMLPAQRRVFVSCRREESANVALQLYEALSARHFDVFLDTLQSRWPQASRPLCGTACAISTCWSCSTPRATSPAVGQRLRGAGPSPSTSPCRSWFGPGTHPCANHTWPRPRSWPTPTSAVAA